MKEWAVELLRCVVCGSRLRTSAFEVEPNGETREGLLMCQSESCTAWYPIVRGIPRMLVPELRPELTRAFAQQFRPELEAHGVTPGPGASVGDDPLHELKHHTIRNFGFEWLEYARFGWDDAVYNLSHEEGVFRRKALMDREELKGKLVLDAGCGNGRYSYWAAQYGARVVGVDLGDGVESASMNTRDLPEVQIVQGDIFSLPFADWTFDAVFSIGVLMHTGNAKRATTSLAKLVKPGGRLTVHLYGKGSLIYEVVDRTLRSWTTRLSVERLQALTRRLYRARRALDRAHLATFVNRFVRIGPHPHIIFDWYAAPIATHHTYPEVFEWFNEMGLKVVRSNDEKVVPLKRRVLRPLCGLPDVVTVQAEVPR